MSCEAAGLRLLAATLTLRCFATTAPSHAHCLLPCAWAGGPTALCPSILIYLAEACCIRALADAESKLQHLHAHFGTNSAEVAMLVHVLGGPPWSFTVHGPEEFDKPEFIGLPEKIRRAAFVVAISSFGRSQLFRLVDHSTGTRSTSCAAVWSRLYAGAADVPRTRDISSASAASANKRGSCCLLEAVRRLAEAWNRFPAGAGRRRRAAPRNRGR